MNKKIKLGIIGCGKIANYHLISMKKAGFNLFSISGTYNSKNAIKLKKKFKINKVFNSTKDHIYSKDYEALLFLTPPEVTYRYLSNIDSTTKVLAEKPITFYSQKLKKLRKKKNIRVALNRRQYKVVELLKSKIKKDFFYLIETFIPENINLQNSLRKTNFKNRKNYFNIFYNSVHVFDTIKYLVGKYKISSIRYIKNKKNKIQGYQVFITSKKVKNIIIKSIFNTPDNFSLIAYSDIERYVLSPLESLKKYKGIKIINPTPQYPLRRYLPIEVKRKFELASTDNKPGFDIQAKAFYNFCNKKKTNLATIDDMLDSINLAEKIFKGL